jgi:hypothetical protein
MADKKRIDELVKLNEEGAKSAREQGKEPDWAKPKKKFKKGGMVKGVSYAKK